MTKKLEQAALAILGFILPKVAIMFILIVVLVKLVWFMVEEVVRGKSERV